MSVGYPSRPQADGINHLDGFANVRIRTVIELIMTKSTSRGRGYASALVGWMTKLADDLDIPCYLDAGMRGLGICDRCGFKAQDIEMRYGGPPPCTPMLRSKKQETVTVS